MKKIFLLLAFILITPFITAQDLPRYLTEEEKELMKTYIPPVYEKGFVTPPTQPVRTMAEWEELEGILIAWTSYQSILRQIVDYAQEEGIVYIVCSDSNSVKSYLTSGGVPLTNLKFIIASFNSVWCRDYGPWCVYSNDADSMYIVDWIYNRPRPQDDLVPGVFATNQNIPLYQMTQAPYDLTATGGNFMADAIGSGFSSKLILNENTSKTEAQINSMMDLFMGIVPYIKMDVLPYDGIHHIDMHMKLLDEETLLVGQYPNGVADGPQIEINLEYILNNFQSKYGRPFKVVRIPMPPDVQGRYPSSGGDYRTYTNSVIVNKTVIVPIYASSYDTTALRIYRENMPGYNVVGINCNSIITALGAIHCITKEIGVREPIFISHPKIQSTINDGNGYPVKAYIKTRTGISSASVYWSVDTTQGYASIPMTQFSPDSFIAFIPEQQINKKVYYYISALSFSGRNLVKPLTSPSGAYQFTVSPAIEITTNTGWNIVSVPFNAPNMNGNVLFPNVESDFFRYDNGYQPVTTLQNGSGYWAKFGSAQNEIITGALVSPYLIPIKAGWNLISVNHYPVNSSNITTIPSGIIYGGFYGYSGSYLVASILYPGYGYWVKSTSDGWLAIPDE